MQIYIKKKVLVDKKMSLMIREIRDYSCNNICRSHGNVEMLLLTGLRFPLVNMGEMLID